jgi:hypothetical protein
MDESGSDANMDIGADVGSDLGDDVGGDDVGIAAGDDVPADIPEDTGVDEVPVDVEDSADSVPEDLADIPEDIPEGGAEDPEVSEEGAPDEPQDIPEDVAPVSEEAPETLETPEAEEAPEASDEPVEMESDESYDVSHDEASAEGENVRVEDTQPEGTADVEDTDITPQDIQDEYAAIQQEAEQDAAELDDKFTEQTDMPYAGEEVHDAIEPEQTTDSSGDDITESHRDESADPYDEYMNNLENYEHDKLETPEQTIVNPNDIYGMRCQDDLPDEAFWNHHDNDKDDYLDLASRIPDVKERLDSGQSLDDIKADPELQATANQYFDPENMVKVTRSGESYLFGQDGRHRILAAQELGHDIPVSVTHEVRPK